VPQARLVIVCKPTLYHRMPKEYENVDWASDPAAMRGRVEAIVDELRLRDCVQIIADSSENPDPFYAAADVLVAPFQNERFSSVALVEAMAFGRPHIVTALGEPLELVERFGAGLAVSGGDEQALAAAMIRVASDRDLLAVLSARARSGAAELTADAAAARLSDLYLALSEGRRKATEVEAVPG